MADHTQATVFESNMAAWQGWQETPWGRIRYRVAADILARTCRRLGDGPLRVLDVGGGDGGDALPLARAGHHVTVLDYSAVMLAAARDRAQAAGVPDLLDTVCADLDDLAGLGLGGYDLVVCHNLIQYRDDTVAAVRSLVAALAPDGALSLAAPNPAAEVLSAVIRRRDLAGASGLLSAHTSRTETFRHEVRRIAPEDGAAALAAAGLASVTHYGIRAVTDYILDNDCKSDPAFFRALEDLELELCDREPFLRTARIWLLVGRR